MFVKFIQDPLAATLAVAVLTAQGMFIELHFANDLLYNLRVRVYEFLLIFIYL